MNRRQFLKSLGLIPAIAIVPSMAFSGLNKPEKVASNFQSYTNDFASGKARESLFSGDLVGIDGEGNYVIYPAGDK